MQYDASDLHKTTTKETSKLFNSLDIKFDIITYSRFKLQRIQAYLKNQEVGWAEIIVDKHLHTSVYSLALPYSWGGILFKQKLYAIKKNILNKEEF